MAPERAHGCGRNPCADARGALERTLYVAMGAGRDQHLNSGRPRAACPEWRADSDHRGATERATGGVVT